MKTFFLATMLMFIAGLSAIAQTRTEETVTTTDSAGNTETVTITRVSESEDITQRNHMLTVNPIKFWLFYNLSYYGAITPSITVGGGLQMPSFTGLDGFGALAEVRFYPRGKSLRGFYVAPNVSYNYLSTGTDAINAYSIGALLGWQWFPGEDFAIGFALGADRYFISESSDRDVSDFFTYNGTMPALRFDIGYAW